MAISQQNRPIKVHSHLGDDVLLFARLNGSDYLSRSFNYDLELISEDQNFNVDDILGKAMSVSVTQADGALRYFSGFVTSAAFDGAKNQLTSYRVTLSPWSWFLDQTSDCRIFQNKSVPDIVHEIVSEHGFSADFEMRLTGNYALRDYCVQYRESDLNFIQRLLEEEGIYYFFQHDTTGKHKMVLADSYSAHDVIPGYDSIKYHHPSQSVVRDYEWIYHWRMQKQVRSGEYVLRDYDFQKPRANLEAQSSITRPHNQATQQRFDYPGGYRESADGEQYARVRIEEQQAAWEVTEGFANCVGLFSGGLFSLENFPRADQNRQYLLTELHYQIAATDYLSGQSVVAETFDCSFNAIESNTPYRPARITPKTWVQGPQTAVVVGPSAEEIWTDEYGRVKVQFHWDRYGQSNENSSCWVRVSQIWAGKQWGAIHIPRIGQEVIVEFLEGDPDQPIITGRVYNGDNKPPYDLPSNATQSGMKSRSSKQGTMQNYNEFRFEDKKGAEQILLHAERNLDTEVENDETHTVDHDRTKTIGNDESSSIGRNRTKTVAKNESYEIGGNRDIVVSKNHTESINENMTLTIGKNLSETVQKDYSERVQGNMSSEIAKNLTERISGQHRVSVTKEQVVQAKKIQLVAQDEITFKAGGAKIILKSNGDITLQGKNINVKGSGVITLKGSSIKEN